MQFTLHPRLSADTIPVADLPLCRLVMMNDTQYPWFTLIPRRMANPTTGVRELSDIPTAEHPQLWAEVMAVHNGLMAITTPTKMNVAALGNLVPQLHIHIIARFEGDKAWPSPVFGLHPAIPYQPSEAGQMVARLKPQLPADWLQPIA